MRVIDIHEAKTHLSSLAEEVAAGEEIVVTKAGKPMMRLVPMEKKIQRRLGVLKGKIHIAPDFDTPLPDELIDAFARRAEQ